MEWLKKLKARRPRYIPDGGGAPHAIVEWIPPEKNPYGVRLLDCRDFCRTMVSMSADPERARRFVELRDSTGAEHTGRSPANMARIAALLRYPLDGQPPDGSLFRAGEMEEKWDIYLHAGWLYFARSWGGELVFRAEVRFTGPQAYVTDIEADSKISGDPVLAVRQVDYLIKSHLLGNEVPHPLPADLSDDPMQIAVYSHSWYGRFAAFGSFDDTTRFGRKFDPDETLR